MHSATGMSSLCFSKIEKANKTWRAMGKGRAERTERRITVVTSTSRPCGYTRKQHSINGNNAATAGSQLKATFVWGTEAP